jgi:uncharacterized membrane protein YheB (UPF0754 family)
MDDFNPLVLLIPLIAGFIGWFTNWLAVKATLYPVEFVGIPPAFGWQGVIPKNTDEMSQSFSKLIHDKLVDMEKIFADIDHDDNEELDKVVEDVSVEIIREFSTKIAPDSWARAREKLREYINMLVRRNVRRVTVEILDRMAAEAGDFIDIDKIAHEALVEDRALLGSVLMDVAGPEFKFIERSGLWFGFLFGIIQMGVWIVYPEGWVLPVAGFLVGYVTNWLAMNLIYEPREPVQIGPFVFQGVFIKRQKEVATHFANVIADRVLTAEKLVRHISQGPNRQRLLDILGALDAQEFGGILRPVFQKDEWKLILAGGVIGTGIGALQVVVLFGGF